jgi:DHA1 family inner membrane transport protein
MCGLGAVATLAMLALLPRKTGSSSPSVSLAREVRVLARQQVWTSLILMLMLMIGQFGLFTYITPTLLEVTGLDENLIPWVLLLNGVGATIGVFLGGKLSDWKLMPSLIAMLLLQAVTLVVIYAVSPYPLPMVVAIVIWGGLNFAIGTPIQTRILAWTADASNLASSLIPSGFNVGIALAASLGSAMLNAGYGYRSLPVAGAMAMLVAVAVAAVSYISEGRSNATPPVPAAAE